MENIRATAFDVFDEARLLGEHTDMIIKSNDREFQVHKIIMCGCSTYFRWEEAFELQLCANYLEMIIIIYIISTANIILLKLPKLTKYINAWKLMSVLPEQRM